MDMEKPRFYVNGHGEVRLQLHGNNHYISNEDAFELFKNIPKVLGPWVKEDHSCYEQWVRKDVKGNPAVDVRLYADGEVWAHYSGFLDGKMFSSANTRLQNVEQAKKWADDNIREKCKDEVVLC